MMQVPMAQGPQYQTALPQPNYNAVKIDINNPQVNATPTPTYPQNQLMAMPIYNSVPTASVYEIPQKSIYQPQQNISQPQAVQEEPVVPPPVIQPVASQPAAMYELPTVPPPVIVQPSVNKETITPPPVVTNESASVAETAPVVASDAVPQKVEVKTPEVETPKVDINGFISKLTNSDYEVQATTMESIASMAQSSPQKATELLDVKVVDALLGIMNKDSSTLTGPTPQQMEIREKIVSGKPTTAAETAEANKITPMEQAERNKAYAIYTVAILQKLYASEIEKMDKTVVPMTELPGAAGVVEQIKNNPNPMVRVAGIDALSYIQRPEYAQDLTTLFTVAKNDKDANVQKVAELALKKLNQLTTTATQSAATEEVKPSVEAAKQ